ncbi:MAG: hypothetical protein RLZZ370_947 [Bacteroidota bacterium]|jgi:hypothetical protein
MTAQKPRIIAFYLPQFHPIPENDLWWGKGFTEWTNVGKAKPLFRGHYQPRVPADLGYYDLRLPESRAAQAAMAKAYGVEGFCYWHYWFGNGKRLLERPFHEVLESGEPDFPFCLGWANHSWEDKQFKKGGTNKLLIKQEYPGDEDYRQHFLYVLKAFRDPRYLRVDDKPIFFIHGTKDFDVTYFIRFWQQLALEHGLKGVHFVANCHDEKDIDHLRSLGFDAVNVVRLFHFMKHEYSLLERMLTKFSRLYLKRGRVVDYRKYFKYFVGPEDKRADCYPSIFPNWDHSPRSGRGGHIFTHSSPAPFKKHVQQVLKLVMEKPENSRLVFLRSWNEWAEGNYMEPDLKFGRGYLEALKEALDEIGKA